MNNKLIVLTALALVAAHDIGIKRANRHAKRILDQQTRELENQNLRIKPLVNYTVATITNPSNYEAAMRLNDECKFVNIVTQK